MGEAGALFGEMRSILQSHPIDTESLWACLRTCRAHDPQWYEEEMLGYLEGFEDLPSPLRTLESLEALDQAIALAPFADFGLSLLKDRMRTHHALALARSERLANVVDLRLAGTFGDEGVLALMASEHLHDLTHLKLNSVQFGLDGARALADAEKLRKLKHLDVANNPIGDQGVTLLTTSKHLSRLTHLIAYRTASGDEGATALANSAFMNQLVHLELQSNKIGDDGAIALASSDHLTNLEILNLKSNIIMDRGAVALIQSTKLAYLTHLNLNRNNLGIEGRNAMWDAEHLNQSKRK